MADPRVDGPEFLGDQAVLQKTVADPVILFVDKDAHETQFTGLFPKGQIKGLGAVELQGPFRKLFAGELPGGLDDILLFLA